MSNKKKLFIILGLIAIMVVFFFGGVFVGQSQRAKPDLLLTTTGQTFYATITQIRENSSISVKGLEINDINYRGKFNFSIKDNTIMTWRSESINISDLNVGDTISITFTDETIADIYPTPLNEVVKIQLLDDEK